MTLQKHAGQTRKESKVDKHEQGTSEITDMGRDLAHQQRVLAGRATAGVTGSQLGLSQVLPQEMGIAM